MWILGRLLDIEEDLISNPALPLNCDVIVGTLLKPFSPSVALSLISKM